jgi:hypothetical protein
MGKLYICGVNGFYHPDNYIALVVDDVNRFCKTDEHKNCKNFLKVLKGEK